MSIAEISVIVARQQLEQAITEHGAESTHATLAALVLQRMQEMAQDDARERVLRAINVSTA